MSADFVSDDELHARFDPLFARIAEDAVRRERERVLAREAVQGLRDAGFGRLRVSPTLGGFGATIPQIFRLLVRLAEADSNLPQILRAHFAFVEALLGTDSRSADPSSWLRLVADGAIFGAAMAERTESTDTTVTLKRAADGDWRLDGTKYYSTGTIYASWIAAVAADGDDRLLLAVPADTQGVTVVDDWDGFGQRLTGSGTTSFDNVVVPDRQIIRRRPRGDLAGDSYLVSYYQLFHIATLAGIARAALRDATRYVQGKTRTFGMPGRSSPRHDPLVQRVIGRLSALAHAAASLAGTSAAAIERASTDAAKSPDPRAVFAAVEIETFEAQQIVIGLVLEATTLLFEVGGASATATPLALDRHWRNARVLASHNPAIQRERAIGDYRLNGTDPADIARAGPASAAETGTPKDA